MRKLRGRLMPPPGKEQPGTAQVDAIVSWLESDIDAAAAQHPRPSRVGLHRLNRKEYANAVRDLLDMNINAEALLPRDDARDGFDNIASALQVSPSFLDQYLSAAQTVGDEALGNAQPCRPVRPTPHGRRHAAAPPGRPAIRHARRHARGALFPG